MRYMVFALFSVCVSFAMAIIVITSITIVGAKIQVGNIAHNAARIAAITQNANDVENEININLQNDNLPTIWNGHELFTVTQLSSVMPGQTGFYLETGPTTPDATVVIQYNVLLPFNKALTLIGGPVLNATFPITEKASYYNETQYTGVGA